jgi:hypothetical protein
LLGADHSDVGLFFSSIRVQAGGESDVASSTNWTWMVVILLAGSPDSPESRRFTKAAIDWRQDSRTRAMRARIGRVLYQRRGQVPVQFGQQRGWWQTSSRTEVAVTAKPKMPEMCCHLRVRRTVVERGWFQITRFGRCESHAEVTFEAIDKLLGCTESGVACRGVRCRRNGHV